MFDVATVLSVRPSALIAPQPVPHSRYLFSTTPKIDHLFRTSVEVLV
jgi:hypothetical protein